MEQSILKSTKKVLHIAPDDTSFDLDVITQINSAFSTLNDLGVGPDAGFVVDTDDELWTDFLDDDKVQLSQVKTFILLTVKLNFDPPQTAHLLNSAEKQLKESTVRISMRRENKEYTPPVSPPINVIDGGDASG